MKNLIERLELLNEKKFPKLTDEEIEMIKKSKIRAMMMYKERTGVSLKDAKYVVDSEFDRRPKNIVLPDFAKRKAYDSSLVQRKLKEYAIDLYTDLGDSFKELANRLKEYKGKKVSYKNLYDIIDDLSKIKKSISFETLNKELKLFWAELVGV